MRILSLKLLNGTSFDIITNTGYNTSNVSYALNRINATEFIQNFYGLDKKFNFSLGSMRLPLRNNKSFEIIIKTCEDDADEIFAFFPCRKKQALFMSLLALLKLIGNMQKIWVCFKYLCSSKRTLILMIIIPSTFKKALIRKPDKGMD